MKEQVLFMFVLTIVVVTKAYLSSDDNALVLEHLIRSLFHYHESPKHPPLKQREEPIFNEAQRQFQNESLLSHNVLRAQHCSPPLVLDDEINTRAQIYADILAYNDTGLIHSNNRLGLFGENLYSVQRSRPIVNIDGFGDKVTRTWYSEILRYDYTKPGYARNIGHFSQVVWKSSKRLGVGYAFSKQRRKMYVVAQYGPPGNYDFAFGSNVIDPTICSWEQENKR
ncbi:unnamed protein product [Adineta ricciae]|uniref:SCP domain-containing protein n=1 Tax=Adineta ricciae TaxID=249248 RepID=A0A814KTK2_ADIRI|nr:unnamed protein product [Adineta ricciae]